MQTQKVTDGFLRGVTLLSEYELVLGSLGDILLYDLSQGKIKSLVSLTDDPTESVFDIKVLPDHYANPPIDFEKHFAENTGSRNATDWIERQNSISVISKKKKNNLFY